MDNIVDSGQQRRVYHKYIVPRQVRDLIFIGTFMNVLWGKITEIYIGVNSGLHSTFCLQAHKFTKIRSRIVEKMPD